MLFRIKIKNFELVHPLTSRSHRSLQEIREWLLKLVFTVMFSLAAGQYFHIKDMLTLVFVTLLCLQPTTLGGLRTGLEQLAVVSTSSLFTLGLIQIVNNYYFTVSVAIILISFFLIYFNKEGLLAVAYFSVLYIGVLGQDKPFSFFMDRVVHLLIGIPIATLLNYAFGVFQYRKKLMARILKMRIFIFNKSARILDSLKSQETPLVESELNELGNYYSQLDRLISTLNDFEKEYRSFFSFLFVKIRNIGQYKLYVWNLHDLLQNIHSTATLSFKSTPADESWQYITVFSEILSRSKLSPLETDLDRFIEDYHEVCRTSSQSIITGSLFSSLIHLKAIQEYEENLPELKGFLRHVELK